MIAIAAVAWFVFCVARGAGIRPGRAILATLAVAVGLALAANAEEAAAHARGGRRWQP